MSKEKIEKLKKAIASTATPDNMKAKMKEKLAELENAKSQVKKKSSSPAVMLFHKPKTADIKKGMTVACADTNGQYTKMCKVLTEGVEFQVEDAEGNKSTLMADEVRLLKKDSKKKGKPAMGKSVKETVESQESKLPGCDELKEEAKQKARKKAEREANPPKKKKISDDFRDRAIVWLKAIVHKMNKKGGADPKSVQKIADKFIDLLSTIRKELSGIESDKFIKEFEEEVKQIIAKLKAK